MKLHPIDLRQVDSRIRQVLNRLPILSALYSFVYDLVTFAYTSLRGFRKWEYIEIGSRPAGVETTKGIELDEDIDGYAITSTTGSSLANIHRDARDRSCCAVCGLCRAIVRRDVDSVESILAVAPRLASMSHCLGFFPLSVALLSGEPTLVRLIISQPGVNTQYVRDQIPPCGDKKWLLAEFSSNPTHVRVGSATALHYACMSNNPEIVRIACSISKDFYAPDASGKLPIDYIDSNSDEGLDLLRIYDKECQDWDRRTSLLDVTFDSAANAILKTDFGLFESILAQPRGIPVKKDGWTLLHVAVMNESMPFVEHVIKSNPSTVNIKGETFFNCFKFIHIVRHPYSFTDGATPLHLACLSGNLEIAGVLLKNGADWKIVDDSGRTALDYIRSSRIENLADEFRHMCEEEDVKRKAEKGEEPEDVSKTDPALEGFPSNMGFPFPGWMMGDEMSEESESEGEEDEEETKLLRAEKLMNLEQIIGSKIIGQRGPVRSISSAIRLKENGWVDPDRPLVMLFLGSSGVGKTELAKQLALFLHEKRGLELDEGQSITEIENKFKFIRVDMSEYQLKHTVSNLTGPPKGYVGYDEEGFLTRRLRKCPRAVVLLDEIEKAHPDVLTLFLQVFDDGRITDTKRGVIHCQNAVFIMTSNLASDEIKNASPMLRKLTRLTEDRPEEFNRIIGNFNRSIHPVLKASLQRDEFLGRINQIVVFLPLDEQDISAVIRKELVTWKRRAAEKHEIYLDWSADVVKKLGTSYDVNYGVRSVIHEVQMVAIQLVAEAQMRGILKKNHLAYLTADERGDIVLKGEPRDGRVRTKNGCRYHII